MIIKIILLFFITTQALAYVPTVESLFRNGSNPDITMNGVSLTISVRRIQPGETVPSAAEDFYKIFFHKGQGDSLKVSQTKYMDNSFTESALVHKVHYNHFGANTLKSGVEQVEKGLFYALLSSLALNNGSQMVNYLKFLGIPAKLNNEIINRQKIDVLASYKSYLAAINRDRNARKTEVNPLNPDDANARERVNQIMDESMYIDTKHVKLGKDEGSMAWLAMINSFEAVVSYQKREVQKIKYKISAGEFEVVCSEYWLANGTHQMPRYMKIKNFNGELYQVEVKNLRHYNEKEDDVSKRLSKWDQILKNKDTQESRPEFLL